MKYLLVLLLLAFPAYAENGWIEGGTVGVGAGNTKRPNAIFVRNDDTSSNPVGAYVTDTWHTIDLLGSNVYGQAINVPSDATAVFLGGLLIITHPATAATCDLWATFRAPGDGLPYDSYQIQALESVIGSGVRSPASLWVPVVNGKFQFYWHATAGCPSLINLSVQAYVRPGSGSVGPQGPPGPQGATGPQGPPGTFPQGPYTAIITGN